MSFYIKNDLTLKYFIKMLFRLFFMNIFLPFLIKILFWILKINNNNIYSNREHLLILYNNSCYDKTYIY